MSQYIVGLNFFISYFFHVFYFKYIFEYLFDYIYHLQLENSLCPPRCGQRKDSTIQSFKMYKLKLQLLIFINLNQPFRLPKISLKVNNQLSSFSAWKNWFIDWPEFFFILFSRNKLYVSQSTQLRISLKFIIYQLTHSALLRVRK